MDSEPDARRDSLTAWACVAFTVAAAVLAQFVGYGIASLFGYAGSDSPAPPIGIALLIAIPPMLIAIAPALAAVYFGIRAGRGGRFVGYGAAVLGALVTVFWVVITISALLQRA